MHLEENKRLTRRTFLKGVSVAAGTLALSRFGAFATHEPPIRIGAVIPLTGALASFGPRFQVAAEIAIEQINAARGPGERPLELIVRDSGTSPTQGVASATDLVALGVPAIFGAAASGVTIPVSSVTVPAGVLLISPSATSPAITNLDDNDLVFRTAPPDTLQGIVLADLAFRVRGYRNISIIARNDAYGAGLADVLRREFEARGGTVSALELYATDTTNFSAQIASASAGNPDAISLITFDEGEQLIIQMVGAGVTNFDLLVDGNKNQDLIDRIVAAIGTAPLEGKVGTAPALAPGPGGAGFDKAYRERQNEDPFVFTPHSYDALALLALAIERTIHAGEAVTGTAISRHIREVANPPGTVVSFNEFDNAFRILSRGGDVNYEGASGSVDLDAAGEPVGPVGTWRIENGRIVDDPVPYSCAAGTPPTCTPPSS